MGSFGGSMNIKLLFFVPSVFFMNIAIVEAAHVSANQLIKHIHVLQEIKKKNNAPKTSLQDHIAVPASWKMTQTDAHMSVYGAQIKETWPTELKKHEALINTIIKNEKILNDSHYVFYHAQVSYFRVLQDLIKYLHEFISIHPEYKDFNFIRAWSAGLAQVNVPESIKSIIAKGGGWWGADGHAKSMICANLSLFGNLDYKTWDRWECTFTYFLNNRNCCPTALETAFQDLFTELGVQNKFIPQLTKLADEFATKEGSLFQIFIPKDLVDSYVYLANAGTLPWMSPIITQYWDPTLGAHTLISPILELYKKNPHSIADLNHLQARIFLTQDFTLNPQSKVKIIRHDTLPKDKKRLYEIKLKKIAEEIAHELVGDALKKGPMQDVARKSLSLENGPILRLAQFLKMI